MKYGLIGEKLGHSFSKEIHEALADYTYELCELVPGAVGEFLTRAEFSAINVTIPYKETVIPYLDEIDEAAKVIGAVNCILNDGGRLLGYNTDFFGVSSLLDKVGIDAGGKVTAILGTGGTSKTVKAVLMAKGAKRIITVSRTPNDDEIGYDELYAMASEVDIIVNTTPVGMYPRGDDVAVDVSHFPKLSGVIDVVYNPLRTRLISEAQELGIPSEGGLYMLVAQAVRAVEIFTKKKLPEDACERVYNDIYNKKENIVLIGMPSSGKSTVGKYISEALGREFIDTDEIATRIAGMPIPEVFKNYGEAKFREIVEAEAVAEAARLSGAVIATGGGAILRDENVKRLKRSGKLYFLDRPPEALIPTDDRPLSSTRMAVVARYNERYPIYTRVANEIIDGDGTVGEVAERIIGKRR